MTVNQHEEEMAGQQSTTLSKLNFHLLTGSSIVSHRPVISPDNRWILCICGSQIRVFHVEDGKLASVLQPPTSGNEAADLTSITLSARSPHSQVYSSTYDGTIRLWDYEDGVLLRTFPSPFRISGIYQPFKDHGFFLLISNKEENNTAVNGAAQDGQQKNTASVEWDLMNLPSLDKKTISAKRRKLMRAVAEDPKCIAFDSRGRYIAAAVGNFLKICDLDGDNFLKHIVPGKDMVAIAIHPREDCIATGDGSGRIILWRGFHNYKTLNKTVLHWHWSPVADLVFSNQGSYLWSGGLEVTLVQWSLAKTGDKDFLARLSSAIKHITLAPNGNIVLSLESGVIQFIGPQRTFLGSIKSLHWPVGLRRKSVVFTYDPLSSCLVLNGPPGILQFYDPDQTAISKTFDVTSQNIIGSADLSSSNVEVVATAFTEDGKWMITTEAIQFETFGGYCVMKFWAADEAKTFSLRTTVAEPHGNGIVNTIKVRPGKSGMRNLAVSLGSDEFKFWMESEEKTMTGSQTVWQCVGQGAFRDMQPTAACFSHDGKKCAVAFQNLVTFWDLETMELEDRVIVDHRDDSPISLLFFSGNDADERKLVAVSEKFMKFWDLKTHAVSSVTSLFGAKIFASPFSDLYARTTVNGVELIKAKAERTFSFPSTVSTIIDVVFTPSAGTDGDSSDVESVFCLTDAGELWAIDERESEAFGAQKLPSAETVPNPILALLPPVESSPEVAEVQDKERIRKSRAKNYVQRLMDAPAHTLVAPRVFLSEHLDFLLLKKTPKVRGKPTGEEEMDMDEAEKQPVAEADDSDEEDLKQSTTASSKPYSSENFVDGGIDASEQDFVDEHDSFDFLNRVRIEPGVEGFAAVLCQKVRELQP